MFRISKGGGNMQKEELLHLHMLMFNLKRYFEGTGTCEILTERYNSLQISPFHIHKDKHAHQEAILTLADEIISHIHKPALPVVNPSPETPLLLVAAAL
jgi:hypothetical protein